MKKVFAFFFLVFLLAPSLLGQSFFEKDTKYVVRRLEGAEGSDHYTFQEIYLDSVIGSAEYYHNTVWKGKDFTKEFYKVENNKLYMIYYLFQNKPKDYHLVYDFNLSRGDSLIIDPVWSDHVYRYKVDSVKTILINGNLKKVQFVNVKTKIRSKYDGYNLNYTFIEGIGCLETGLVFMERLPVIEFEEWKCLRVCMNDTAYFPKLNDSTLQFMETPCISDSMRNVVEIENSQSPEKVLIHPNPVINQLSIENFIGKIQLYNLTGSLVLEDTIGNQKTLNIQFLPKGIYYLKLYNNKGSKVLKVLKL